MIVHFLKEISLEQLRNKINNIIMETNKKYKLTDEYITINNEKLYRIEALIDFTFVRKGDRGGFIESEQNLSQDGNCWVFDNAKIYNNARVCENARIYNNAEVYCNAHIGENAFIHNDAEIYGNAKVYGNACITNNANIFGYAEVSDRACVFGNSYIYGNTKVYGQAKIFGDTRVWGNAKIHGNTKICGYIEICGNAEISENSDYIIFKNWWSSGRYFIWTRSNNMWRVGCFYGTGQQLIEKAYADDDFSGQEYERVVKYVESILNNN